MKGIKFLLLTAASLMQMLPVLCQQTGKQVVLLTEYCRHGARVNGRVLPGMDLISKYGKYNLTSTGMRQHYLLGKELSFRYSNLFTRNSTNPTQVEVFSSPLPRTQMSAISQLLGLYSPGTGPNISTLDSAWWTPPLETGVDVEADLQAAVPKGFNFYPLTVQSEEMDFLFMPSIESACPLAAKVHRERKQKSYEELDSITDELASELEEAGLHSVELYNSSKWNLQNLFLFADDMLCYRSEYGTQYPRLTENLSRKLRTFLGVRIAIDYLDHETSLLLSDGIAKSIIQGMDDVVMNTSKAKKFRLFMGHDSGMLAQIFLLRLSSLACLNATMHDKTPGSEWCLNYPDFASQLLYELIHDVDEKKHYVRVLFNGTPVPICANSAGPDHHCEYNSFKSTFLKALTFNSAEEFAKFCGSNYLNNRRRWRTPEEQKLEAAKHESERKTAIIWVVVIGFVINLLMIVTLILKASKVRKRASNSRRFLDSHDHDDLNS